jgi:hypothetical protein
MDWHDVSVRYDAETGAIAVHVDGAGSPVLPAADLRVSAPPVAKAGRMATARVRMTPPAVRRPTAVTIEVVGSEADRAGSDRVWVLPGR